MKKIYFLLTTLLLISVGLVSLIEAQNYKIQQYLNIKSANSPTFSPDGKRIAYLTNVTGTMQVWTASLQNSKIEQLTNYDDNVGFVRWMADGNLIFGKAKGGDENTQFYWMKADGSGVRALTNDPTVRHNFGLVADDGKMIAYASNKRNRNFFDIYSMNIASGVETLRYQSDGNNDIAAINGDGSKFVISRDGTEFSLDNNLYLVDRKDGRELLLTPHKDASEYGNVHFTADGLVFTNNGDREFISLAQMRKKNASGDDWSDANRETAILDNSNWDVGDVEMNTYGGMMAYTLNREGFSELYLRKYETDGKPLITVVDKRSEMVKLPGQGIVSGLTFNKDQSQLAFTFSSATRNADVWLYDMKAKALKQVTHSDQVGISPLTFIEPKLIKYRSFDGREISAWFYRPERTKALNTKAGNFMIGVRPTADLPVIVSVHGGPEGQERPGFNALYQYYLSRGYAILATNVRGSTGYGKTFTHLDDVKKREDSVKDLKYAVDWLTTAGGADPKRIAIMGGSYGGYMTLAAITLYPDIWAAAVDTVGIGNWESFLKNTSGYRRRQREVEYGRLDRDIDFLRSISPLAKVDRIKAPLFVIAGRNDPRVPYTEAEQMVAALRKRGAVVEYKLYDDEGHGVSKLKNRIELYPLVADFLDKNMKK